MQNARLSDFCQFVFCQTTCLMLLPDVSPYPIITSILPLLFILSVSLFKEAVEDFKSATLFLATIFSLPEQRDAYIHIQQTRSHHRRHRRDRRANCMRYTRLAGDGSEQQIRSRDLTVGTILKVWFGFHSFCWCVVGVLSFFFDLFILLDRSVSTVPWVFILLTCAASYLVTANSMTCTLETFGAFLSNYRSAYKPQKRKKKQQEA